MLFLVLVLLSSSVLSIVLKYLNTRSPYSVYFVNYITCALLAFVSMEPKTLYQGDLTPCWLGAITGLFYLSSLAVNGYSIHKNGAILSSVFTRLGVLVPIVLSVTLFGERPTLLQGLGVVLAVAAAVLMNGLPQKAQSPAPAGQVSLPILVLALLLNGISDAMSKVFTQLGRRQDDGLFMFYIFLFAGLATLGLLLRPGAQFSHGAGCVFRGVGGRSQLSFLPPFAGCPHRAACLPGLSLLQRGGDPDHQRGQFLPVP